MNTVTVTDKTINIDGVQCAVVSDIVKEGNKTTETTKDYFAQDKDGNVWYSARIQKRSRRGSQS